MESFLSAYTAGTQLLAYGGKYISLYLYMLVMLISNFLLYRISNLKIRYQTGYRFIPVFRHAVLSLIRWTLLAKQAAEC